MNSWLNELPGLHPAGKRNEVLINPDDAATLGILDGDRVRVFSQVGEIEVDASLSGRLRRGLVVVDHGWGSRIFDPRGGDAPQSYGVNRNLLIDGESALADLDAEFVLRRTRAVVGRRGSTVIVTVSRSGSDPDAPAAVPPRPTAGAPVSSVWMSGRYTAVIPRFGGGDPGAGRLAASDAVSSLPHQATALL
jgi:formylmethanofuran dehydrogenase subunit D